MLADALAACHDVNLATEAAAANLVEAQALRWVGEFVGYPVGGGAFTSGGMVSNLTALAAARERAFPGSRRRGSGRPSRGVYCSLRRPLLRPRAAEILGLGSECGACVPLDERAAHARRTRPPRRSTRDRADGS